MKMKGVVSLIAYATQCQYMLIPTEESGDLGYYPENIPGYGTRGWWCAAPLPPSPPRHPGLPVTTSRG